MPLPEQLVAIRNVIKKSIERGLPIPILVPFGGRKTDIKSSVDIAEVFAINQLISLNRCVKKYYSPGLFINIRVEDTGAKWLFRNEEENDYSVDRYSNDFEKLVNILKGDAFINPVKESSLMNLVDYFHESSTYSELLKNILTKQLAFPDINVHSIPEYNIISDLVWKGDLNNEQRLFYIKRYQTLYPNLETEDYIQKLADYLGGSKARYDLGGKAEPKTQVGSYIELAFVPPVPGAPESLFSTRVYWRCLPMSQGRTHIAPWRAKGYFKIGEEICGKIISFNDPLMKELIHSTTIIETENDRIDLSTDYIIE